MLVPSLMMLTLPGPARPLIVPAKVVAAPPRLLPIVSVLVFRFTIEEAAPVREATTWPKPPFRFSTEPPRPTSSIVTAERGATGSAPATLAFKMPVPAPPLLRMKVGPL